MSKERALLIGAVEWMQELKYVYADARDSGDRVLLELIADINKIENLLAQPEQEPSDTEIITAYQMLVRRKLGLQDFKVLGLENEQEPYRTIMNNIQEHFGVDDER